MSSSTSTIVRESSEFRVTDRKQAVQILRNVCDAPEASIESITVPEALNRTVANFPDRNALMYKDEVSKTWNGITFKEYKERIERIAKVFIKLGLEVHGTVAVLAFNCPEWFISELAAIHAG